MRPSISSNDDTQKTSELIVSSPRDESQGRRSLISKQPLIAVSALVTILSLTIISGMALSSNSTVTPCSADSMDATCVTPTIQNTMVAVVMNTVAIPPTSLPSVTVPPLPVASPTTLSGIGGNGCALQVTTAIHEQSLQCLLQSYNPAIKTDPQLLQLADEHARYLSNLSTQSIATTDLYIWRGMITIEQLPGSVQPPYPRKLHLLIVVSSDALTLNMLLEEASDRALLLNDSYTAYGFATHHSLNRRHHMVLILAD